MAGASVATDQVRTAVRFPMKLALKLKTTNGMIDAVTENISANGILFASEHLPPVRSEIHFTILMPGAVMGQKNDVLVDCVGRVVRHQLSGDTMLAGAIIDEYKQRLATSTI